MFKRRDEIRAIASEGGYILLTVTDHVIGVNEIKAGVFLEAGEEGAGFLDLDRVPPHVRNTHKLLFLRTEAHRVGIDPSQAWQLTFFTGTCEQLHTQADAQYGYPALQYALVENWNQIPSL